MNTHEDDDLTRLARRGDSAAITELLSKHRRRLRRMIQIHWDERLNPRADPSDIVQEALAEAARRLPEYLKAQSVSLYPWLRSLAYDRLVATYRKHVKAQRRTVTAEAADELELPDASAWKLANKIAGRESTPSHKLMREESREQVRSALKKLSPPDRRVLVMRFLEQLSIEETAEVLGISPAAVSTRQFRALQRFKNVLKTEH
jgi:RNA polymerase sigma-70 factor (ECF subfamily)